MSNLNDLVAQLEAAGVIITGLTDRTKLLSIQWETNWQAEFVRFVVQGIPDGVLFRCSKSDALSAVDIDRVLSGYAFSFDQRDLIIKNIATPIRAADGGEKGGKAMDEDHKKGKTLRLVRRQPPGPNAKSSPSDAIATSNPDYYERNRLWLNPAVSAVCLLTMPAIFTNIYGTAPWPTWLTMSLGAIAMCLLGIGLWRTDTFSARAIQSVALPVAIVATVYFT